MAECVRQHPRNAADDRIRSIAPGTREHPFFYFAILFQHEQRQIAFAHRTAQPLERSTLHLGGTVSIQAAMNRANRSCAPAPRCTVSGAAHNCSGAASPNNSVSLT